MTDLQIIATQRALVREAIGKMRAAAEYFGTGKPADHHERLPAFQAKVDELEEWMFRDGPLA